MENVVEKVSQIHGLESLLHATSSPFPNFLDVVFFHLKQCFSILGTESMWMDVNDGVRVEA